MDGGIRSCLAFVLCSFLKVEEPGKYWQPQKKKRRKEKEK